MRLYRREDSKFLWCEFGLDGRMYRFSTKQTNEKKAERWAGMKQASIEGRGGPVIRRSPRLEDFAPRFLEWFNKTDRSAASRKYYANGVRLLEATEIWKLHLDQITKSMVEALQFPHSPSTANSALRTLRRMLHQAKEDGLLAEVPKTPLRKEQGRTLVLDDEAEQKLIPHLKQDYADVLAVLRECGARTGEVFAMRWEHVNWTDGFYANPTGKTPAARRALIVANRIAEIFHRRHLAQKLPSEGWIFPGIRTAGHMKAATFNEAFRVARRKAGLPEALVPYCSRHNFGTTMMIATGNPSVVMGLMGHTDLSTTLRYSHPPASEVAKIRKVLNDRAEKTPHVYHTFPKSDEERAENFYQVDENKERIPVSN
jgi:integrase